MPPLLEVKVIVVIPKVPHNFLKFSKTAMIDIRGALEKSTPEVPWNCVSNNFYLLLFQQCVLENVLIVSIDCLDTGPDAESKYFRVRVPLVWSQTNCSGVLTKIQFSGIFQVSALEGITVDMGVDPINQKN
jgi:hypothetical protein